MKEPIIHTINGATVAMYPMKEVEAVTVIARFHAGSWYEGKEWGAHHLLEHVMCDGGKTFPSRESIELFKEENGLSSNASTGMEDLEFFVKSPKTKLSEALLFLFDEIAHPLLSKEAIELNKTIIAQEYKDKWSNPSNRFWRSSVKNLYGENHAYTRDGMGKMEFVEQLKRPELLKIYKTFCVSENMTIVAVGNFKEEELVSLLTKELNKMPHGNAQMPTIDGHHRENSYFFWAEDVLKVNIEVEWQTPDITKETSIQDRLAVNIARYMLGGSSRSRLYKELRMKRGWVYGAYAAKGFLPTMSWFSVGTSVDVTKLQEVYKILIFETKKMISEEISDEEFERSRNFLKMQMLMAFDSVSSIAGNLMSDLFFENKIYMPEEINRIMDTITKADVVRLLSTYLKTEPTVSVMAKTDPKLKIT